MRILGRANSGNVQKVLWCAGELGLDFEREDVGGSFGGNDTPEYRALNPNGRVPTWVEGDFALWESNTIVRYLAATHGAEPLYPRDVRRRALAEKWMDWELSLVSPLLHPVFWGTIRTPAEQRDVPAIDAARSQLSRALAILDAALEKTAYLAGDALSIGDLPLGIAAHRWFQMPIQREDYPGLRDWYERLRARPAFRRYVDLPLS